MYMIKLNQEDINDLNRSITSNKIKALDQTDSLPNPTRPLKKNEHQCSSNYFNKKPHNHLNRCRKGL
jgi:hypothetical protein